MNKARTFLISGLATMTLIITLIETGLFQLEPQPLIAQEEETGLILEKDGEQVLIPLEEWVVVSSAYEPSNTVGGLYMGMTVDALRIQEKGESFEREITMDEIGSIFTGKIKSTKEYVWGGVKLGGLIAATGGLIVGITCLGPNFDGLLISAEMGFIYSIFTVPAGALIGYIRGQVAQGNAVEYVIGDGEWVIVK